MHIWKYAGVNVYMDAGKHICMQKFNYDTMLVLMYTGMEWCKYACIMVFMYTSIQLCKFAGMHELNYAYKYAKVHKLDSMKVCK